MRLPSQILLLAASFLVLPAIISAAQTAAPAKIEGATLVGASANAIDPMDAAKYLGVTYKRESEGFRVTPPAGSRMINRSGVDLVSFVVDAKSWGGSLQRISLKDPITLDDFINITKADITRTGVPTDPTQQVNIFKGVQILEDRRVKMGQYDAALFTFSAQVDLGPMVPDAVMERMGMATEKAGKKAPARPGAPAPVDTVSILRQEMIVRIRDGLFAVLMLYTPLKDREVATHTWQLMIPEFEIYDTAAIARKRSEAAAVGRDWLAKRSAEELRSKLISEPQYFRMTAATTDVGFFRFGELTQEKGPGGSIVDVTRDNHKGVLITVQMFSYNDADGAVSYANNEAFWSYSKDSKGEALPGYATWQNVSKTRTKIVAPAARGGTPVVQQVTPWLQESGILTQTGVPLPNVPPPPFQISVQLDGDRTQRVANGVNALIPPTAAPALPKALEYTWTRFVDLNKPSEMTFSSFNSKTQKMGTRNLIVTGQKENV
ncbi:MAG TPA: hypothetical protein VHM90_09035, partial [Phycisphaerae bacterium]|nr:hypothetical protein [Phycisphaerae bacterium]